MTAPLEEREMMALLRELQGLEPDDKELHHLQVLFRHAGPQPRSIMERIAKFVHGAAPVTDLRGGEVQALVELQTDDCSIMLDLQPRPGGGCFDVHGQVFSETLPTASGEVVFSSAESRLAVVSLDEYGEFDLAGLPRGDYRATWHFPAARIVVPELKLG